MNKSPIIFLILFSISFLLTNAQKNFKEGYVLLSETDTLTGLVNNNSYNMNAVICDFKPIGSDSVKKYYPNEIYGYRFKNGKYYVSKNITMDKRDTVFFMECLIQGELKIFFLQSHSRINHYYASKDGVHLKELKYSKGVVYDESKMYEKETKEYIGILNYLTSDCEEMKDDILRINNPNHKKLIKFSEKYHNKVCNDKECVIYEKKMPVQWQIEINGGWHAQTLDKDEYSSINNTFLGVSAYLNNPRFSERSYFGLGFVYEGKSTKKDTGREYANFKIPISYGYVSPKKGFSPVFFGDVNIRNYDLAIFTSISFRPGVKYDFGNTSLKIYADFEFASWIIIPVAYYATNIGLSINYKINHMKSFSD